MSRNKVNKKTRPIREYAVTDAVEHLITCAIATNDWRHAAVHTLHALHILVKYCGMDDAEKLCDELQGSFSHTLEIDLLEATPQSLTAH